MNGRMNGSPKDRLDFLVLWMELGIMSQDFMRLFFEKIRNRPIGVKMLMLKNK